MTYGCATLESMTNKTPLFGTESTRNQRKLTANGNSPGSPLVADVRRAALGQKENFIRNLFTYPEYKDYLPRPKGLSGLTLEKLVGQQNHLRLLTHLEL